MQFTAFLKFKTMTRTILHVILAYLMVVSKAILAKAVWELSRQGQQHAPSKDTFPAPSLRTPILGFCD